LNHSKGVRKKKSAIATILLLKINQKWFLCYHLPCSFKIFINVFAFLYERGNSKKIFFLFVEKNADVSIFVEIQG